MGPSAANRGRILTLALMLSLALWLLAWYWDTADAMVTLWQNSDTFAHGFVILPISAWLIWRRRAELAALEPRPCWLAGLVLTALGFAWLFAGLSGVGVVQQYALVLMVPLLAWLVLGTRIARSLAFPLLFLAFAVPFGEALQPPLMEHTADFVVLALRLSGIPVYREGLLFSIPSGTWSVVEACSGLRYLMASLTLGVLYAYLTYRSAWRRALFILASAIVPIVANWLRAYLIVMIGHLSSMRLAVGIDHLVYGWLFFGVVIMALFWAGSFWREDLAASAPPAPSARAPRLAPLAAAALAGAALVALWPQAAMLLDTRRPGELALQAPPASAGWQRTERRPTDWQPPIQPRAQLEQFFAKEESNAGLYIGYYRNQGPGMQLVSSGNVLVPPGDKRWQSAGELHREVVLKRTQLPVTEIRLRGRTNGVLVWRAYWIGGRYVANPYAAKLLQAKAKLFGDGDDGAVIMVYAAYDERPQAAEQALQEFLEAMLPAITSVLEHARRA